MSVSMSVSVSVFSFLLLLVVVAVVVSFFLPSVFCLSVVVLSGPFLLHLCYRGYLNGSEYSH